MLPNGKVLVAGGLSFFCGCAAVSAELYDPATGTWAATGSLGQGRLSHTATLLPNGMVLVAGGQDIGSNSLASAELYEPATGTWSATGSLGAARVEHTTTLLPNGEVLAAGGFDSSGALASAELYDSTSGSWTATGSLGTGRYLQTATLLPNGKVLVTAGIDSSGNLSPGAERYDSASGTWTATGSLATARYLHTATLLPNGKVLVAGGVETLNIGFGIVSAELYGSDLGVTSTDPACNSVISTQPTDFVVNVNDPVNPGTLQGSDFTVNGTPANTVNYTSGAITMTFHFNSSPVVTQGVQTMDIPAGAFNRASDNQPNLDFTCTFCYAIMPLQVTTTDPPVEGTFSPPAPGDYQYDVNFNQAIDPASVQTSDLTLTGNAGGSVRAASVINGNMTARFTLHFIFGGSVTASIGAGAMTAFGCNGNMTFSGDYTVEGGCLLGNYVITPGTDTIVPGTTDTGNHIDDGDTLISLPFPFTLYENTYTSVNVSSNGRLDFVCGVHDTFGVLIACIPPPANQCPYDFTIFGLWEDLRTDFGLRGCAGFPGGNCGIFTSVTGSAPDRIFNIEWRAVLFANNAARQNFEVRLYENPAMNQRFDVIYGTLDTRRHDHPYVGGVQGDSDAGFFTQDFCGDIPPQNISRTYTMPPCGNLNILGAASVKGLFAIDLPLTGPSGVEDRSGGPNKKFTVAMTFDQNITSVGSASSTCGTVQSIVIDGTDAHKVNFNLVNVAHACNGSTITITANSISDDQGGFLSSASVPMGLLLGDVNGDRVVNRLDTNEAQTHKGQRTVQQNFRNDVNANGHIEHSDIQLIQQQNGTSLP
ncbi:MAG: kelch repeat-containing protein [Bryobacteraceae bacterium]